MNIKGGQYKTNACCDAFYTAYFLKKYLQKLRVDR